MEFEWDERKRARIIAERALDFVPAFRGRPRSISDATRRRGALEDDGNDEGALFTFVWAGAAKTSA